MRGAPRVHLVGARLRRRRALEHRAPRRAHRDGGARRRARTSSSTPSPTGATRCRRRRAGSSRPSRAGAREAGDRARGERRRALLRDGPRQPLGARAARLRPARARASPSTTAPTAAPTRARRLRARRDRRVRRRRRASARRARSAPATRSSRFNFRPDRMRELSCALAGRTRGRAGARDRPPRRAAGRALHDADRRTAARRGDHPVAFVSERPAVTLPTRHRRARRAPAARRRDREVPARDVLLRRRQGAPGGGRAARARALAARRADVRPQAADERARGDRRRSSTPGARRTSASRSSTSPTPTWSATRASSRPRSKAIETVDACLARIVEAVQRDRRRLHRHRRPRQRRPHARARRLAEHRALAEPGAVRRHASRAPRWTRRAASSPTSRRRRSSCSASRSRPR